VLRLASAGSGIDTMRPDGKAWLAERVLHLELSKKGVYASILASTRACQHAMTGSGVKSKSPSPSDSDTESAVDPENLATRNNVSDPFYSDNWRKLWN